MADTFVIIGLRRKYAEIKGRICYTADCWDEPTLETLRQVGNVLRLFSPDENLSAIKPKRPYKGERSRQWTRTALDVMRASGEPLTGREIARRVAKAHGVTDNETLFSIEASLHSTLERREGVVRVAGAPKRWALDNGDRD